ncbi:acyltransferase family protein [Limibacillus halophilus]|uniref:Peptidoglycan/LPS O-acetylase OafA/YrhL n=1 Tax=Limibacillus halophilus TaxID=1579333 RepID=A0A839SXN3_9PROT|nr:acyltransferase family protein [Limibacillus halophilus]MBB3066839.1 peptidoglycan/LPS O-acetylase OafA/YrhL [Limibacillus halophilus]
MRSERVFRPDIEGLRGLSVLLIVFYHLEVSLLPGGFIGVDVFFVISGFLITRLIIDDISAGTFTFRAFYLRRLRRLGPALLFTLAVSLFLAALSLSGGRLLDHILATLWALLGLSNIFFWIQTDYLQEPGGLALLHTWSLGVEEQFYLIWPAVLVLLSGSGAFAGRRFLPAMSAFLIAAAAGSLALSEYWLDRDASAVFFLTPFRAAEFAAGALLVFFSRQPIRIPVVIRNAMVVCGLGSILFAALRYSVEMRFPGLSSLVPAMGAVLIIAAGDPSVLRMPLGNRPLRWIGRISYSLYLIHFPVIVFFGLWSLLPNPFLDGLAMFLLSVLSAWGIHHWIEQPFRARSIVATNTGSKRFLAGLGGFAGVIAVACAILWQSGGLYDRLAEQSRALEAHRVDISRLRRRSIRFPECHMDFRVDDWKRYYSVAFESCNPVSPGRSYTMVVGDSTAADFWRALREAYQVEVLQFTGNGCVRNEKAHCAFLYRAAETFILAHKDQIDTVFVTGAYRDATHHFHLDWALLLQKKGVPVVLVGAPPYLPFRVMPTAIQLGSVEALVRKTGGKVSDMSAAENGRLAAKARKSGLPYLSRSTLFCPLETCELANAQAEAYFLDHRHMTPAGISQLGKILRRRFTSLDDVIAYAFATLK